MIRKTRSDLKDISGMIFGRLYISHLKEIKNYNTYWWCWCACGNSTIGNGNSIRMGRTTSCGCFAKEQRHKNDHGDANKWARYHYLYNSWRKHIQHITSGRTIDIPYAGMPIDPIWKDNYLAFKEYIIHILGDRPSIVHTIDIINHRLGFVRNNLRWATKSEQSKNRRTFFTAEPIDLFNRLISSVSGTVS